ncbi:Hypothetical predicted protein [Cloeon dipterum]|uniref:Uncharacterized protein n=1 Tax=Cloeon dipterum TaxID=197152 RepID=A0A8S1DL88_9INSE|nr:Hypothetical predicted protein [Cloeon dipterum]
MSGSGESKAMDVGFSEEELDDDFSEETMDDDDFSEEEDQEPMNIQSVDSSSSLKQKLKHINRHRKHIPAILYAAEFGDLEVCQELVNQGEDVNVRDMYGYDVYHYASMNAKHGLELIDFFKFSGAIMERENVAEVDAVTDAFNQWNFDFAIKLFNCYESEEASKLSFLGYCICSSLDLLKKVFETNPSVAKVKGSDEVFDKEISYEAASSGSLSEMSYQKALCLICELPTADGAVSAVHVDKEKLKTWFLNACEYELADEIEDDDLICLFCVCHAEFQWKFDEMADENLVWWNLDLDDAARELRKNYFEGNLEQCWVQLEKIKLPESDSEDDGRPTKAIYHIQVVFSEAPHGYTQLAQ